MQGSIFDRRFLIVGGKGGVGKSTLSAALALAARDQGKRVLVAELGGKEKVASLLGYDGEVGYRVTRVCDGVDVINVTPTEALHEYGLMKLRWERVYQAVFENPVMRSLTRMIPGMNELVLIGKAWHLEQEKDASGAPRWDVIIVDAPATGHGISLLVLPHVITETVKTGPMLQETRLIRDLLVDPTRTCMNLVTTPEEMPVQESLELRARMDDVLRVKPGVLFINRVWPQAYDPSLTAALNTYSKDVIERDPRFAAVLATTRFLQRRRAAQEEHLKTLQERCDMSSMEIPFQFSATFGLEQVRVIAQLIRAECAP